MRRIRYLFIVLLLVLMAGCKNSKKVRQTKAPVAGQSPGFEKVEDMKDIYYRFPSPDEMLSIIDKSKLSFNDGIILPVDNSSRYLDSKSQSLNLGVYIADMAYIMLFQRQKEAITYFQVVYGLSDKLRMSSAFDPALMKRFENNLDNPDSLRALSDEAMNDITDYLTQNDKERTFAVISIGGFIETLYLAFNVAGPYSQDNPLIQRISDQKLVLNNLLNYALQYASDENVSDAIKILDPIRAVYNELITKEGQTKVRKLPDGKLVISGGDKVTISPEQYNKLRDVTFKARKLITENLEN